MKSVIIVENLSKEYKIGTHTGYLTVRDSLTNLFRNPFHFIKQTKLSKKNKFWALKNISFEVQQGEVIGIIGSNGAGKSTLLKILTGITEPTEGEALIHGRIGSLLEVGTGFHPELTGRENIFLNGAILGMTKKEIKRKFNEIVDFSGVGKFLETPVKRFSSGMQVRLAFAVAAHLEPEILLIDEVLAVGDAAFQKKCLGKMDEVTKNQGRTILFVSHNMDAVQSLCKRCIWLEKGEIRMIGETNKIIDTYLQSSTKEKAEIIFPHKHNKEAQILKVTVKDEKNHSTTALNYARPFYIEIEYKLYKKIPQFFLTLKLGYESIRGKYVVVTLSNDNNYQTPNQTGKYKARLKIPTLLNIGRYNFFVALTTHMMSNAPYLDSTPAIDITLNQTDTTPYPFVHRSPDSLTLIPLDWDIVKTS